MAILDTDEYFYHQKRNIAVDTLNDLLLKLEQESFCAITVRWTMMYGEGIMLKQNKTLFESYPRMCRTVSDAKILARAQLTKISIPHYARCKTGKYIRKKWNFDDVPKVALLHYKSKSIQEYLLKEDQSLPPFTRRPIKTYDHTGATCNLSDFAYSKDYERSFMNVYKEFKTLHSPEPILLLPPPMLNIKHMPDKGDAAYTLFIYLKYRAAKREEFDHERYLSINADAKKAVENRTVLDGLHHFMLNYATGVQGCWKTDTYSICE